MEPAKIVYLPAPVASARARLAELNAKREAARAASRRPSFVPLAQDSRPQRSGQAKTIKPVRPNLGLEAAYRQRLDALIKAMNDSVQYWLRAAYRANEPRIAQDAAPADILKRVVKELSGRWQTKFDEAAPKLADYFATAVDRRSDAALRKILKDAGMTVKFRMTPAQKDIFQATVNQNVALIKSIPERYFTEVEGAVMRSVQTGRDLGSLTNDLQNQYGVTRRRAALIARDQNYKATSALNHARQRELGITEAIWVHSGGGKHPRSTHVHMDGKRYDVAKGMYDPAVGEYVFPGQLINCRCVSRAVVPGFS